MSKKDRVVLFGTGWAFRNFIKNENHDYTILAVTDWEYQKHGETLNGIRVINPYDLKSLEYDFVLIVSTFVSEIKQQLWERCKIGEGKIRVPFKDTIKGTKPFEDLKTKGFAHEVISYFSKLAADNGITLFLDYGTLLGFVRDGDVIKWDDDVDFSINYEHVDIFTELLLKYRNDFPNADDVDWYVEVRKDSNNRIRNFSLRFKNRLEKTFREFELGVRVRKTYGDVSVVMRGKYPAHNAKHFQKYDIIKIGGKQLYCPKDYNEYLTFVYGNWKEPKKLQFGRKVNSLKTNNLSIEKDELVLERLF